MITEVAHNQARYTSMTTRDVVPNALFFST